METPKTAQASKIFMWDVPHKCPALESQAASQARASDLRYYA